MSRKALLLVGSPKGFRSASGILGSYLLRQLAGRGWQTEQLWIRNTWAQPSDLTDAVDAADLVILSAPLYVDSAPGPVVQAMEMLVRHRRGGAAARTPFLAIVQSGFPEAYQNDTALAIYRRFAADAGFDWMGGLALGAGAILRVDRALEEAGDMLQNARTSLDLTADALTAGQAAPQEAIGLMAQNVAPPGLYRAMGQRTWVKVATRAGLSLRQMFARPYEPDRLVRVIDLADLTQLEVQAETAEVVTWQGRQALKLNGMAMLKDLNLSEGVLELDLGVDPGAAYPGLLFHGAGGQNHELIYCQPHSSGQWDALQYDPVFHGTNTWQVFQGPAYQGTADLPSGSWFTLRADLSRRQAAAWLLRDGEAFSPGERPAQLRVEQLAHPQTNGQLGVWTYRPAYFGQLRIYAPRRHGTEPPAPANQGRAVAAPPGTVTTWELEGYGPVTAEPNGTLCLNRYIRQAAQPQAVLHHTFEVARGEVELSFGFSDELRLAVDDQELFAGENRFQGFGDRPARGYIEPETHTLALMLNPGRHTLTAVLTAKEPFGWGLTLAVRETE